MPSSKTTSKEEQSLYFYIQKFFSSAINQAKVSKYYVDILINDIKCVIEFDGLYWHKEKSDIDYEKTRELNKLGYYVVRVREVLLPLIKISKGIIIPYNHKETTKSYGSVRFIVDTIHHLAQFQKDKSMKCKMIDFTLSPSQYENDLRLIVAPLHDKFVLNNIKCCFGSEMWDYQKNGNLNPFNIEFSSLTPKLYFICKENILHFDYVTRWCIPQNNRSIDSTHEFIDNLRKIHCTYFKSCDVQNCKYKEKIFLELVNNKIPVNELHSTFNSLPFRKEFGIVLQKALEPQNIDYLMSLIRRYRPENNLHFYTAEPIPFEWVKTKDDLDMLERFIQYCKKSGFEPNISQSFNELRRIINQKEERFNLIKNAGKF